MKEREKLIEELKQFPMLAQITDADREDLLLLLKKEASEKSLASLHEE